MNEENEVIVEEEDQTPDELTLLKQRADMLGIKYHPNTGADKLKAKIDLKLNGDKPKEKVLNKTQKRTYMTHDEFIKERSTNIRKHINSLVRIRATCMNPNKKDWEGEIISVGSAKMGTYKKYVPFNIEWHVPQIILDAMKDRNYSQFYNVRGPRGEKIRKAKLVPEFSIEVLPPLTKEELRALAQRQAMAAGKDA